MAYAVDVAVVVFAVSSMSAVGLTYTLRQIVGPLANVRLVVLGLIANFVLVPGWALLVTVVLDLDDPYQVGLLVVAAAAGAPFLVKLVAVSGGDVAFAASPLVLLLPATIVYMPLVVPLIAPEVDVDAWAIARPLLLTNLLPLGAGFAVLAAAPSFAARLRPVLGPLSTVALVALFALTVTANAPELAEVVGERAIIGAVLLVVGAFVIGFMLGLPDRHRGEIGLATAQRNLAAATVVAAQAIGDADTLVTVVVTLTVSIALLFPLTPMLKRRYGRVTQAERRARASAPSRHRYRSGAAPAHRRERHA